MLSLSTDVIANTLGLGRRVYYAGAGQEWSKVMRLEDYRDVRCRALCWVARALRARVIVLAGMDFAFSGGWRSYQQPLRYEPEAEYMVARDMRGNAVLTDAANVSAAEWFLGICLALRDAGVRVINASESGLLGEHVEARRLAEAVEELGENKV